VIEVPSQDVVGGGENENEKGNVSEGVEDTVESSESPSSRDRAY
jgi:hypothetical protein